VNCCSHNCDVWLELCKGELCCSESHDNAAININCICTLSLRIPLKELCLLTQCYGNVSIIPILLLHMHNCCCYNVMILPMNCIRLVYIGTPWMLNFNRLCLLHASVYVCVTCAINDVLYIQPIASTSQIVVHTLMMVTLEVFDEESLGDSEVCLSILLFVSMMVLLHVVGNFISGCLGNGTPTSAGRILGESELTEITVIPCIIAIHVRLIFRILLVE